MKKIIDTLLRTGYSKTTKDGKQEQGFKRVLDILLKLDASVKELDEVHAELIEIGAYTWGSSEPKSAVLRTVDSLSFSLQDKISDCCEWLHDIGIAE